MFMHLALACLALATAHSYVINTEKKCTCLDDSCVCVNKQLCNQDGILINDEAIYDLENDMHSFLSCNNDTDKRCCRLPDGFIAEEPHLNCGGRKNVDSINKTFIEKGEYPWFVTLQLKLGGEHRHKGYGTLIHPQVVLTATHLMKMIDINTLKEDDIMVTTAVTSSNSFINPDLDNQQRFVKEVIVHTPYNRSLYNDVALIILDKPVTLSENVGLLCLPDENVSFNTGDLCEVVGFEEGVTGIRHLKKVIRPLVERNDCEFKLQKSRENMTTFSLHKSFICAGGEEGSCVGDGGSALMCNNTSGNTYILGITSWAINCGTKDVPAVYVNVPMFRHWILEQIDKYI